MSIRIVSDSASDLFSLPDVDYATVPLKVMFGGVEYVDTADTDCERMIDALADHNGPSTTSCPNVHEWLRAFDGADEVFGVTISSGLSASYNSAVMAEQQYLEANPDAKVFIFDSLATGPVERLIIEKLRELILAGKSFDEIRDQTLEYQDKVRILYALESLGNLARNGRVNAHVARIAGALNIRLIGHASDEGTVEILHRSRGDRRTLKTLVREMGKRGFCGGTVHIDHCLNPDAAARLKELIGQEWPQSSVHVHACGALCSYYADKGGLIVGYDVADA